LSRDQTSLYTKIDIFFPVHGKGDYVGAQSKTNVKWPAREWSELGNRDIDHRARGVRVRAREAIESSLSEFRCEPHCFALLTADKTDPGYPQPIAGNWRGLGQ
jgi:hypothetical protein